MTIHRARSVRVAACVLLTLLAAAGCRRASDEGPILASGYVEATEVRVAAEVGGRVLAVEIDEGDRVEPGAVIARLDTRDTDLALQRVLAARAQAESQLRLLRAGTRPEEVRQTLAQRESAEADVAAAESELRAAATDLQRFEGLLAANAGSRKQRDDAATKHEVAEARVAAARERARAASEALARARAGARDEELAGAVARVEAVEAEIAVLRKRQTDAVVTAPVAGVVTSRLVDPGEIVPPGTPLAIVTDLDRAWANVYVGEPVVPAIALGQRVPLVTSGGQRIEGRVTFISPRAEFTPRNVQTADERTKLVYRIKVTTDNREGLLKVGMPIDAEIAR